MQTFQERRELLKQFGDDPVNPLVALLKCAAGLLILVGVAATPWLILNSDAARMAAEQPAFQMARSFPSVAESKRIFEERRQRFEASGKPAVQAVEARLAAGPSRAVK